MLNQEQMNGKWDEIKGGIKNLWRDITDADLEAANRDIQAVPGIVHERYGESKDSIKEKLNSLMASFDNETDKSLKLNDGESSFERKPLGESHTSKLQDTDEFISSGLSSHSDVEDRIARH